MGSSLLSSQLQVSGADFESKNLNEFFLSLVTIQQLRMASRYISRRYGSTATSATQSRASSQIRETESLSSCSQHRARSLAPVSGLSLMSSMSSPSEQDSLMRYYSGYLDTGTRVRSRASQHRETRTPEPETASTKQSLALKTLHLPIWTSSWRNYSGRGLASTSQFLGAGPVRSVRMATPTWDPPRVTIYHKSTVNCRY